MPELFSGRLRRHASTNAPLRGRTLGTNALVANILRGVVAAGLLASASVNLRAQGAPAKAASESDKVRAVVEQYLHGLKFNDVPSLQRAFWPEARLMFLKPDQSMGQLTQADWYKGFAASAGKEEAGDLKITTVDVTGDIASVKVTETYAKSVYIDYLNMLRVNGKWMIVNKVYTRQTR
jgi:hypothetical protein